MTVSDTTTDTPAGTTYEWRLTCTDADNESALLLQEYLWGLEGLQTIEEVYRPNTDDVLDYKLDGVNCLAHMTGLKVFSADANFGEQVKALLLREEAFRGWGLSDAKAITLEDWAESWKQHWQPTPVIETLTICPSWIDYMPQNDQEKVLKLDPGVAFGTGTHNTTCVMLQCIEAFSKSHDISQLSVLDVGTGSGILAVYAAMLGCRAVIGIDNDMNSLPAAQANAKLNGVDSACTFSLSPIEDLCHTRHDLVLANIIAPVIIALLPEMLLRLAPGGTLMLSGLIKKNLTEVIGALNAHGLTEIHKRQLGDWFALEVTAPEA